MTAKVHDTALKARDILIPQQTVLGYLYSLQILLYKSQVIFLPVEVSTWKKYKQEIDCVFTVTLETLATNYIIC